MLYLAGPDAEEAPLPAHAVVSIEAQERCRSVPGWIDAVSRHIGGVSASLREQELHTCSPVGLGGFRGRLEYAELGSAVLFKQTTTPHQFSRSIRFRSPTIPTPLIVAVQLSGRDHFPHQDRSYTLYPGDWCLIDTRKPIEFSSIGKTAEVLGLVVERPSDGELLNLVESGTGRRFEGKAGLSRILQKTLIETFEEIDRISLSGRKGLQNAVTSIAWDALRQQLEQPARLLYGDMQCAALKAYIDSHLNDSELSVDSVAAGCRMSVRSVHRAFERDPVGSISRYIWMRRITRCAAALRDSEQSHRSITDLCFSWGFNSTSHFSRLFKDQFGVPPSIYRANRLHIDGEVQGEQIRLPPPAF